jgi:hypothetical protein
MWAKLSTDEKKRLAKKIVCTKSGKSERARTPGRDFMPTCRFNYWTDQPEIHAWCKQLVIRSGSDRVRYRPTRDELSTGYPQLVDKAVDVSLPKWLMFGDFPADTWGIVGHDERQTPPNRGQRQLVGTEPNEQLDN